MKKTKLQGIEFLRFIAIVAIIIFHINSKLLPGGFLGVDLFFVISGYLLMTSLLKDPDKYNFTKYKNLIKKNIKRVYPALITMIILVLAFMATFYRDLLVSVHKDSIFSATFTANWWYIFQKVDYFDSFGIVSPFKHLWYLAVNQQLYIFVPLMYVFTSRTNSVKRNSERFVELLIVLAIASFVSMIMHYDINSINRVYYGTDTRAFEFLIGAVAAYFLPVDKLTADDNKKENLKFFFISLGLLLIFIIMTIKISQFSLWIYKWGFLLIAIFCLALLLSVIKAGNIWQKSPLSVIFLLIGQISYSLYIWHWPIVVLSLTKSEMLGPNFKLTVIRAIVFTLVAFFSYLYLEKGRFTLSKRKLMRKFNMRKTSGKVKFGFTCFILFLSVLGLFGQGLPFVSGMMTTNKVSSNMNKTYKTNKGIQAQEEPKKGKNETITNVASQVKSTYLLSYAKSALISPKDAKKGEIKDIEEKQNTEKNTKNEKKEKEIVNENVYKTAIVFGDSLAVNVGDYFSEQYPGIIVDGEIGRQLYNSDEEVKKYAQYDSRDTAMIFFLGSNGYFEESHVESLLASFKLSDIYFVNVSLPREWEGPVNKVLADYAKKHDRVKIVDWYTASLGHEEYFEPDGIHTNHQGRVKLQEILDKTLTRKIKISK